MQKSTKFGLPGQKHDKIGESHRGAVCLEGNALIIPVELPEPLEEIRQQYDPVGCTIPAHITVSFPFGDHPDVPRVSPQLLSLAQQFEPFTVAFHQLSQFDQGDQAIVILKLRRSRRLMQLFQRVWTEFPQYPPYQGQHQAVIPHITIARLPASSLKMFGSVSQVVQKYQPQLSWRVTQLMLVVNREVIHEPPLQFIFPFAGISMP